MIAEKVAMDTARHTPRAERPARAPRVVSARRRARVGRVRKLRVVCINTRTRKRSHKLPDAPLRRRRADANLGAPRPGNTRVPSPRAPGGVLARPREGSSALKTLRS